MHQNYQPMQSNKLILESFPSHETNFLRLPAWISADRFLGKNSPFNLWLN